MTEKEFEDHDCHLSLDDGCAICEAWWIEKEEGPCPVCDGERTVLQGQDDSYHLVKCPFCISEPTEVGAVMTQDR